MQADQDAPVAFIRSDVIVTGAIAQALMYRPKQNTYYDPGTALAVAQQKLAQFNRDIEDMSNADNALDNRDISWDYDADPAYGSGANWSQSHDS